ncbi:LADA_0B00672g1_1 [Lachancea dasiensis]|uniref:LADA_0B00672g1_1 n=1 Tax=Lachancea dasiensis TaxID=1072105 RepID=A0A1G4IRN9_9SACH|nr:LADA_0B00672g1_1 [Lachancea dasiensis]
MSSHNVESMLNQLSMSLEVNYNHADQLFDYLETILMNSTEKSAQIAALQKMSGSFAQLTMSMADLRDDHTSVVESYNTKLKLAPLADVAKSRLTVTSNSDGQASEMLEYLNEVNDSHNLQLEHTNLIGRLSSNLCDAASAFSQVEKEDYFDLESWLQSYKSEDASVETREILKSRLVSWITSIKMEKARYLVENQHILRDMLKSLTSDVAQWRTNYESIESMLFGDAHNSIAKTLLDITNLRQELDRKSEDEDIEMERT